MTGQTDDAKKAIGDALSFPILTEEISLPGTPREAAPTPGRLPIEQIVQGAIGEVLGQRPSPSDPKSFLEALNKSFSLQEVAGHGEYKWTPRGYTAYTEMGAVTGAQASLYTRATSALDDSLPLLEGLKPLRADSDPEDSQAARAIVRSHLTELVAELGEVGGPTVQRVDDLFRLLLGVDVSTAFVKQAGARGGVVVPDDHFSVDPEKVGGSLGLLRERLGLEQGRVNTIEEEQNFTNFLILVDHVHCLFQSWLAFREGFVGTNGEVFFGTQLVLLSRSLGVVAESVEETYFAMNSVFLGPEERQTTKLPLSKPGEPEAPITIAELLGWVRGVAVEEGPRLIQEGGKDGVIALTPTLDTLTRLVSKTSDLASDPAHPGNPTSAFHTARVQRALEELTAHLQEASDLADDITRSRPAVTAVDPSLITASGDQRLDVDGEEFQEGAQVVLRNQTSSPPPVLDVELVGDKPTVVSPNQVRATFHLDEAHNGTWDVVVINPDGGSGILTQEFEVSIVSILSITSEDRLPLPPQVLSVNPGSGEQGQNPVVEVRGQGFAPGATLDFGPRIGVGVLSFNPATSVFRAEISIPRRASLGKRDVSVTNPDGQTGTLVEGFEVTAPLSEP